MRIAVYCGSSRRSLPVYLDAARAVGSEIARRGHTLVFGGGRTGLMGAAADAALEAKGSVVGVILRDFIEQDAHHLGVPLQTVDDMRSRKAGLDDEADAFVALPGGFGTLEELSEILSFRKLKLHERQLVLLNVERFFDPLLAWIDRAIADGFERERSREFYAVTDDPRIAVDLCEGR